jgi:hypothetical protein
MKQRPKSGEIAATFAFLAFRNFQRFASAGRFLKPPDPAPCLIEQSLWMDFFAQIIVYYTCS